MNGAASGVPSGASVSSFERNPVPSPLTQPIIEPTYEPYRPPPVHSLERTNPFDKNKVSSFEDKTSGIYSTLSLNKTIPLTNKEEQNFREEKPTEKIVEPLPTATFTTSSGFDYSYKPPPLPTYIPQKSVEKPEPVVPAPVVPAPVVLPPTVAADVVRTEPRHKFERKLSDADIVFGSKPEPYTSSFKVESYSRNRSNSSFTSTSTDSTYMYGNRDALKNSSFQKSLSVSSDKDGDFSNDPAVIASRPVVGINNDAFSDYTPKSTKPTKKAWGHDDEDDDYDLK